MLKKENRLRTGREINKILSKGFAKRTKHLSCRYLLAKPAGPVRLTVVVSKKVAASAVVRNRLKRRVREAFDSQLVGKNALALMIFPNKAAIDADFNTLIEEARQCLDAQRSS